MSENGTNGAAPPLKPRDRRDTAPLVKWDAYEGEDLVFRGFEARSAADALATATRVTQRRITSVRLAPERHETVKLAEGKKKK